MTRAYGISRSSAPFPRAAISRGRLLFGLLGGAIAWTVHLLATWAVAEWSCLGGFLQGRLFGIFGVAWLQILVSAATLAVALTAGLAARRAFTRLRENPDASQDPAASQLFVARAGYITSFLFSFIIAVESIPILYFLRGC